MGITLAIAIALTLCMVAMGLYCCKRGLSRSSAKRLFGANVGIFFGLMVVTTIILFSGGVVAAGGASDSAVAAATASAKGLAAIGAALSTGLATIGAGIAVAFTGSAALGAISEDQSILGKSMIFVGLAEGIAIYGLIISILILNQ